MDKTELEALVTEAVRDADLRPDEIPAIDLYVDQITCLAADKLLEGSPRFYDRVLTKTMINNYSKDGLISPIKGKKYSKEQILQMLLVYSLKNTLSIGEIKRVLQNVYAAPNCNAKMLEHIYAHFLELKEEQRVQMWPLVDNFTEKTELNIEDDADFFTLILGLASLSSYIKNVTQALLEARYPDVESEKAREDQEKKRQKEEKKAAKNKKDEADSSDGKGGAE